MQVIEHLAAPTTGAHGQVLLAIQQLGWNLKADSPSSVLFERLDWLRGNVQCTAVLAPGLLVLTAELPFRYGPIIEQSLRTVVSEFSNEFSALIAEPVPEDAPDPQAADGILLTTPVDPSTALSSRPLEPSTPAPLAYSPLGVTHSTSDTDGPLISTLGDSAEYSEDGFGIGPGGGSEGSASSIGGEGEDPATVFNPQTEHPKLKTAPAVEPAAEGALDAASKQTRRAAAVTEAHRVKNRLDQGVGPQERAALEARLHKLQDEVRALS